MYGRILAAIGITLLAIVLLWGTAFYFQWVAIPFYGKLEKRTIVHRGAYQIQSYEAFYRWQEELDGIDAKLNAYPVELDLRQRMECQGLLAKRANVVAEYNAASRAEETRGQWQAEDLPQQLQNEVIRTCG